jgi:HlyD family secretion protein
VAVARAETQLAQAERELERQRRLVEDNLTTRERLELAQEAVDLARNALEAARLDRRSLAPDGPEVRRLEEQLVAARADLARTEIHSESSGIILTRNVEPGDLVRPGDVLFTLALDGVTELRVPIDERNLARLELGQNATAIADAYPDAPFPARIHLIAPRIDPQRGTVDVRLTVPEPPDFLRQDMTVSVTIETGYREQALALPNDALMQRSGRQAEVMLLRDGRVERRTVTIGLEGLARSEILSGLESGDRVLLAAGSGLEEGDRVRFRERPWPAAGTRVSVYVNNELPIQLD